MTSTQICTLVTAGFCTNGSLVLVNYAVANGIAGISFSVGNSFPVWHALFNLTFLGQAMTPGQISGVFVAVIGQVVLSLDEKLDYMCCVNGKKNVMLEEVVDVARDDKLSIE